MEEMHGSQIQFVKQSVNTKSKTQIRDRGILKTLETVDLRSD